MWLLWTLSNTEEKNVSRDWPKFSRETGQSAAERLAKVQRRDWPKFSGETGQSSAERLAKVQRRDWPKFSGGTGQSKNWRVIVYIQLDTIRLASLADVK